MLGKKRRVSEGKPDKLRGGQRENLPGRENALSKEQRRRSKVGRRV